MLQTQLFAAETQRRQLLNSTLVFTDAFRVGMIRSRQLCFDNDGVLDMLETRINARYHEIDLIMNEARRPAEGGTTEKVQVCRDGGQDAAAAVEFKHVRLLPFGEDIMAKSVWEIIELGGVVTKSDTRVARSTSDMVGLVSRHTVPLGKNASVSADVHTVIKRFNANTGLVALIESHSEWSIKYPASGVARSTTEEGGWFMVHECPLKARGSTQRVSQLQSMVKLRPNESKTGGKTNALTSTMVDIVIPSFRDILSSHHQKVENFLLDSKCN
ncbi:Mitogen-activated protein kinase MMK1 [Phytophthora nicotianae]|uniref:Mitogen-activated protein kinase MMK1 n=1 Tax=Phytophthora nicotianae TaxID=4792 RepID=A0A0W8DCY0_PHYNI|nr:Mitogen-activated protein kinase MMK1 [Phytophthora nicotianae]